MRLRPKPGNYSIASSSVPDKRITLVNHPDHGFEQFPMTQEDKSKQLFEFQEWSKNKNYYRIKSDHSNRYWTAKCSEILDGKICTNCLIESEFAVHDQHQLFAFDNHLDGTWSIISVACNKEYIDKRKTRQVVDLHQNLTTDGARINIYWPFEKQSNQKWILYPDSIPSDNYTIQEYSELFTDESPSANVYWLYAIILAGVICAAVFLYFIIYWVLKSRKNEKDSEGNNNNEETESIAQPDIIETLPKQMLIKADEQSVAAIVERMTKNHESIKEIMKRHSRQTMEGSELSDEFFAEGNAPNSMMFTSSRPSNRIKSFSF